MVPRKPQTLVRKVLTSLTFWILVGTAVGILLGSQAPDFSKKAAPTANVFLRPVQFIVFPLVFSTLVVGIAGNGDLKALGRVALKAFIYFEVVTTLALVLGLVAVNLVKPGDNGYKTVANPNVTTSDKFTYAIWINHLTPKTWGEMMGGSGSSELLQVLVASVVFGCATALADPKSKQRVLDIADAVMWIMFKFVDIVIWTAPVGVCFSIASAVANNGGLSVLSSLGLLVVTLYLTLVVFILVVFGPVFVYMKLNPIEFFRGMKEPLIIAYTTATSEAALPKVFEALEAFGVSPHITSFVVPFGYSFNLDGSTLYLTLASIFCAQAAGIEKSIGEQVTMVLMLMISSKGVAGVRSASIIVIAATLDQFAIPAWTVGLLLGADWFMDMARTFTNVLGNCLAAVVMAKLEGEFRKPGWETLLHTTHDVQEDKVGGLEEELIADKERYSHN
ncbi:hypothetical protein DYB37_011296 [Aphanomyces astaci]|uniref:Amino acid transporter n=2 Tax=Aphanomyces astaci TaxID=112090 RepID=A0A397DCS6_APHAT|nr:hypothetical protein DYB38_002424 [Aphanomyces astaci]RHY75075.1 hypothetical protein DYB30_009518 [Aphanomyces astaci]RHY83898.1 hypothetical protein DYB35_006216 [Aphanomyces astaci]RHZ21021.1 hypothetical protein DYB37_011296 [Aphanomyces astaci]RLO10026.1 hypothetical protein DYB28_006513 [Aphanomyces astaci]